MPVGEKSYSIELVEGQNQPELQGWYSPEYNLYESNVASIYRTQLQESGTLAWLLFPSHENSSTINATIVSQDDQKIVLDVQSDQDSMQITIPYADSQEVTVVVN